MSTSWNLAVPKHMNAAPDDPMDKLPTIMDGRFRMHPPAPSAFHLSVLVSTVLAERLVHTDKSGMIM